MKPATAFEKVGFRKSDLGGSTNMSPNYEFEPKFEKSSAVAQYSCQNGFVLPSSEQSRCATRRCASAFAHTHFIFPRVQHLTHTHLYTSNTQTHAHLLMVPSFCNPPVQQPTAQQHDYHDHGDWFLREFVSQPPGGKSNVRV